MDLFHDTTLAPNLGAVAIGHLEDTNGDARFDDDDLTDVVASTEGGVVTVYRGDGTLLWSATAASTEQTSPAIGDLDGDGQPDVFVYSLTGGAALDGADGSLLWRGPAPGGTKAYCGAVELADLDGDGDSEAIFGRMILNGQTGAVLAEGAYGYGSALAGESPNSVVADLDLDGRQEVIVGNAAYEMDGSALWATGETDGFAAVGNFDADPEGEVVVDHGDSTVELLDTDGSTIWRATVGGSALGPPAIADFDGDGAPEIAVPTATGVVMFDGSGTLRWTTTTTGTGRMFDGVSAYDLDGDGRWEVLDTGPGGLGVLDGTTGGVLASYVETAPNFNCGQNASIADVDHDGSVDIGYGLYGITGDSTTSSNGFRVVSDAAAAFTAGIGTWNEHSYNLTNVNDNDTIPAHPTPSFSKSNSFRAGPTIGSDASTANVVGVVDDVCVDRCAAGGTLQVTYALGNDAALEVSEDVDVAFWASTSGPDVLLGTTTWTATLPGTTMADAQALTFTSFPTPLLDVRIEIDPDDRLPECDETDNRAAWGAVICP